MVPTASQCPAPPITSINVMIVTALSRISIWEVSLQGRKFGRQAFIARSKLNSWYAVILGFACSTSQNANEYGSDFFVSLLFDHQP